MTDKNNENLEPVLQLHQVKMPEGGKLPQTAVKYTGSREQVDTLNIVTSPSPGVKGSTTTAQNPAVKNGASDNGPQGVDSSQGTKKKPTDEERSQAMAKAASNNRTENTTQMRPGSEMAGFSVGLNQLDPQMVTIQREKGQKSELRDGIDIEIDINKIEGGSNVPGDSGNGPGQAEAALKSLLGQAKQSQSGQEPQSAVQQQQNIETKSELPLNAVDVTKTGNGGLDKSREKYHSQKSNLNGTGTISAKNRAINSQEIGGEIMEHNDLNGSGGAHLFHRNNNMGSLPTSGVVNGFLNSQHRGRHVKNKTIMSGTENTVRNHFSQEDGFGGANIHGQGMNSYMQGPANTTLTDGRFNFSGNNSRINYKYGHHRRGNSIMSSLQQTRGRPFNGHNVTGSAEGKNLFTPPLGSDFHHTVASSGAGVGGRAAQSSGIGGPMTRNSHRRVGTTGFNGTRLDNFYDSDPLTAGAVGPHSTLLPMSTGTHGQGPFSMNQLKFEDRPRPIDHHQRNLLSLRMHKNQNTERHKYVIRQIHKELRAHGNLGSDPARLSNVQSFLSPQLKDRFMKHKGHMQLAGFMNEINKAALHVYDQLKCYKSDQACTLELILQCYNSIFVQQYDIFYKSDNEREKNLEQSAKDMKERETELKTQEQNLTAKLSSIESLLTGYKKEIEQLKASEKSNLQIIQQLNQQIKEQKQQIEHRMKVTDDELVMAKMAVLQGNTSVKGTQQNTNQTNQLAKITGTGAQPNKKMTSKDHNIFQKNYDNMIEDFAFSKEDTYNIEEELTNAMNTFYEEQLEERRMALEEIQKTVGFMIRNQDGVQASSGVPGTDNALRKHAETQTMLSMLSDDPEALASGQGIVMSPTGGLTDPHDSLMMMGTEGSKTKGKGGNKNTMSPGNISRGGTGGSAMTSLLNQPPNKKMTAGMKKLAEMQATIQKETQVEMAERAQEEADAEIDAASVAFSNNEMNKDPFHVPYDNAIAKYGKTSRQLYDSDQKEVTQLFNQMNERFDYLIRKEVEKKIEKGQEDSGNPNAFGNTTWSLPSHILIFLQGSIKKIEQVKLRLIQWPDFKKMIFDILYHRVITHAPEINGCINNSYISLDEHLLIYMVDQYSPSGSMAKKGMLHRGTRQEIEKVVMEFLFSLKYYSTRWRRAYTYAELVGFLHSAESYKQYVEINQSMFKGQNIYTKINETILKAASGVNDFNIKDVEIPLNDIYLQDFFFYCFSFYAKESKQFVDSDEGFTYVKLRAEIMHSRNILNTLHGDTGSGMKYPESWQSAIKEKVQRRKANKNDEAETDFIDVDELLWMYVKEYRVIRKQKIIEYKERFLSKQNLMQRQNDGQKVFSWQEMRDLYQAILPPQQKSPILNLSYAKDICCIRAFIYALTCDQNDQQISIEAFLAGCNRFGIDNPLPIITKRLAMHGNQEEIVKEFKMLATEKYKAHAHEVDALAPIDVNNAGGSSFENSLKGPRYMDFQETKRASPTKKVSGIYNFNLLTSQIGRELIKKPGENLTVGGAPGGSATDQAPNSNHADNSSKLYSIGGVRMNIKEITGLSRIESAHIDDIGRNNASISSIQHSLKSEYKPPTKKKPLFGGMTGEAFATFNSMEKDMTKQEIGISNKKIIIPSFETTSKLFAQHFHILRELRHKIELLGQARGKQRSLERSWLQIDQILEILKKACIFLDFPEDNQDEPDFNKEIDVFNN